MTDVTEALGRLERLVERQIALLEAHAAPAPERSLPDVNEHEPIDQICATGILASLAAKDDYTRGVIERLTAAVQKLGAIEVCDCLDDEESELLGSPDADGWPLVKRQNMRLLYRTLRAAARNLGTSYSVVA
jgi:hypothetical protein